MENRRYFGLIGEVVHDNPTAEMMEAAFRTAGLPWSYISVAVAPEHFADSVGAARLLGFSGLHITKPYKIDAVAAVDELTPAAAAIGAVNCIVRRSGRLLGDNTDGRGLVNAVSPKCALEGAMVVVLGAGGAARAVAVEVALAGAGQIVIVSRSRRPGDSLVEAVRAASHAACRWDPWAGTYRISPDADLVVNATSVGMADPGRCPDIDLTDVGDATVIADVVIAGRPTALSKKAQQHGLASVAGSEMLVQQASISFELWAGRTADESSLRDALDGALGT